MEKLSAIIWVIYGDNSTGAINAGTAFIGTRKKFMLIKLIYVLIHGNWPNLGTIGGIKIDLVISGDNL